MELQTRRLHTISTCLTGTRANAIIIGCVHLHKFLFVCDYKIKKFPHRAAKKSLNKIQQKPIHEHALKMVDVIFLDEAGQISAEEIATIDIILCKLRNSKEPFDGVLR